MKFHERLEIVINEIKKISGLTVESVAGKLGISKATLNNYKSGRFYPKAQFFSRLEEEYPYIDIEWLTNDNAPSPEKTYIKNINSKIVDIAHSDIILQFKDKDRARDANRALLEIEKLDQAAFIEICAYIKGVASGIKKTKSNHDRRKGERRQEDSDTWNGPDRRSGNDRRKASGE